MPRKSQQVETRMVAEYMAREYGQYTFLTKVPLGQIPEQLAAAAGMEKALGIMRPFRPEVDAVVILPRYLIIIEAKVWNVINGLAKLPLYKSLVPVTPELRQYMPREVLMELVVGWSNPNLEVMASSAGVTVKVYAPEWLMAVVQGMHKYWTREYQEERAKKLHMREYFGVE